MSERLGQLEELGLDYVYVVPGELGFADPVGRESIEGVARLISGLGG